MSVVTLQGKAKSLKLYNLSNGIDLDSYEFNSQEDLDDIYNIVQELVESSEAENSNDVVTIKCMNFDDIYFAINDKEVNIDELNLKNIIPKEILKEIKSANVGDLIALHTLEGEGRWDIEVDANEIKVSSLNINYIDCSEYFDESDLIREEYLDLICDTILPDTLRAKNRKSSIKDFYLDPTQSYIELYKVVKNDGLKILEKLDSKGRVLAGTDFIVDDFEEN
jgi:hypothetical protein